MSFLIHQIGQFVMVLVIMAFALFGTVGIITLIKKFFPSIDITTNSITHKQKEQK